jgi:hypothetical protein
LVTGHAKEILAGVELWIEIDDQHALTPVAHRREMPRQVGTKGTFADAALHVDDRDLLSHPVLLCRSLVLATALRQHMHRESPR